VWRLAIAMATIVDALGSCRQRRADDPPLRRLTTIAGLDMSQGGADPTHVSVKQTPTRALASQADQGSAAFTARASRRVKKNLQLGIFSACARPTIDAPFEKTPVRAVAPRRNEPRRFDRTSGGLL
jgi:hypothetical protein